MLAWLDRAISTFRLWRWFQRRGQRRTVLEKIWRDDLDEARRMLEALADPVSRFQLACLELDAGRLDAAEHHALAVPDEAVRRLLLGLVERRSGVEGAFRGGEPSWLAALNGAWVEAGKPDFRDSMYLTEDFALSFDPGDRVAALEPGERAIWQKMVKLPTMLAQPSRASVAWASDLSGERSLPELVIAAGVLSGGRGAKKRAPQHARVIAALAERAPENLFVRLAAFGHPSLHVLGAREIAELDRVLAAPEVLASISPAVHDRFLEVATRAGSRSPEMLAALGVVTTLVLPPLDQLYAAFDATTGAAQRAAAERYILLGRRLHADPTLISFIIGNSLIERGARALDDQRVFDELAAYRDEGRQYAGVHHHLRCDPITLPLRGLVRECLDVRLRDERGHYRELLRRQTS